MWGSRSGWIISAVIAVVFGTVLVIGAMPAGIEESSGALRDVGMQPLALPIGPLTVFKQGTEARDAGPIYRQAMQDYDLHPDQYADWQKDVVSALAANPLAVQKLVEARNCDHMDLFAKDPTELVNYDNKTPSLSAIQAIGTLAEQMAFLAAHNKDMAKARQYAEAVFALGYNLSTERVRFEEWSDGVELMRLSSLDLKITDPDQAAALGKFADATDKYMTDTIRPFWTKLDSVSPTYTDKAGFTRSLAGDYYELAQKSPERLWRIEAILRLGRLTHDAPTRGDQLVTRHFLANLAADTSQDPLVHQAAVKAYDVVNNDAEYYRIS